MRKNQRLVQTALSLLIYGGCNSSLPNCKKDDRYIECSESIRNIASQIKCIEKESKIFGKYRILLEENSEKRFAYADNTSTQLFGDLKVKVIKGRFYFSIEIESIESGTFASFYRSACSEADNLEQPKYGIYESTAIAANRNE